jgi:hypothetical protein
MDEAARNALAEAVYRQQVMEHVARRQAQTLADGTPFMQRLLSTQEPTGKVEDRRELPPAVETPLTPDEKRRKGIALWIEPPPTQLARDGGFFDIGR